MGNFCHVDLCGLHKDFNSSSKSYWDSAQSDAVDRILAISKCKTRDDLNMKTDKFLSCINNTYKCDKNYLISVYSVLKWFIDNNWADTKRWLQETIETLAQAAKDRLTETVNQLNSNRDPRAKKGKKEVSVKVDSVKAPIAKKTASVNEEFPTFSEASFPDTSKDLFAEMLSKGSKMPKV